MKFVSSRRGTSFFLGFQRKYFKGISFNTLEASVLINQLTSNNSVCNNIAGIVSKSSV